MHLVKGTLLPLTLSPRCKLYWVHSPKEVASNLKILSWEIFCMLCWSLDQQYTYNQHKTNDMVKSSPKKCTVNRVSFDKDQTKYSWSRLWLQVHLFSNYTLTYSLRIPAIRGAKFQWNSLIHTLQTTFSQNWANSYFQVGICHNCFLISHNLNLVYLLGGWAPCTWIH